MNASLNFADVAELSRLSGVLDRHCEQIGRDPATIRRGVQFPLPDDPDETMRAVERYVQAGFRDILFMATGARIPELEATAELLPKLCDIGD